MSSPNDAEAFEEADLAEGTSLLLKAPEEGNWTPPHGFLWIELAIFANVFLYGFDGTVTAATYAVISSEFDAANTASWLTTAYLVTATSFQPLYGRLSDIFGRRICFFVSTITFAAGCLRCGLANSITAVNIMRALTGFGGGGLMTMATIVNSDMIPFRRRGMYQALQNSMFGFGAICGASFGGTIADSIGWRWCFLIQVPISAISLFLGCLVIRNPLELHPTWGEIKEKVDFTGSLLLVVGLSVQPVGLSLGGNELPWSNGWVIGSLIASFVLLGPFFLVETRTTAIPVIPLRLLRVRNAVAVQMANVCAGAAAYAYLFMLPLFFQVVLEDSPTKEGARLAVPSFATPVRGIISGIVMSRWGKLIPLVRLGAILMTFGNALVTSLAFYDSTWKYIVYIFPANPVQGIIYPGILFTSLASFNHDDHTVTASTVYLIRSLGNVWGVAITATIVQNTLRSRLPSVLLNVPNKEEIIERIRHYVTALYTLPPDIQIAARQAYYDGIRYSFAASTGIAAVGIVASFFAYHAGLRNTH